jgi:hypothetical protein
MAYGGLKMTHQKMIKESIQTTIFMFMIWIPELIITSNLIPKVIIAPQMDTKICPMFRKK